jgi:integrase
MQTLHQQFIPQLPIEDADVASVPIPILMQTIESMPYGHRMRVWLKYLFYTGCRPCETEKALICNILKRHIIWWYPGKRQKDPRKEVLPKEFIDELEYMHTKTACPQNKLFPFTGQSATRQFNKYWRPKYPEWNEKAEALTKNGFVQHYKMQIMGIRKTFATLWFYKYWKYYDDANVAVLMVSKKMRHSSINITAYHYIQECDRIQAHKYLHLLPHEICSNMSQDNLINYF